MTQRQLAGPRSRQFRLQRYQKWGVYAVLALLAAEMPLLAIHDVAKKYINVAKGSTTDD